MRERYELHVGARKATAVLAMEPTLVAPVPQG